MNEHQFSSLAERISKDGKYAPGMLNCLGAVLRVSADFETARAKVQNDRHLSAEGKRAKSTEVAKDAVKSLLEASKPQRWIEAQVAGERMNMKPAPVATADARGELRRREIRDFVRGLPVDKRFSAAMELAADDDALNALLDAPAALSGLPAQQFQHLGDLYSERHHGPRLAELKAMEEDGQVAGAGVGIVMNELKAASGLPDHQWEAHVNAVRGEIEKGVVICRPRASRTSIRP